MCTSQPISENGFVLQPLTSCSGVPEEHSVLRQDRSKIGNHGAAESCSCAQHVPFPRIALILSHSYKALMIWGTESSTHGSSRKRKWWATALLRQIGYGHHALTELHGLGRATEARQNSLRHDVVEDSSPST